MIVDIVVCMSCMFSHSKRIIPQRTLSYKCSFS
jgi:hypothetical protein